VPGYQSSADAFAPARQIIDLLRSALAAAARGQVHPDAATDIGLDLLSIMHFGIISQHLANDVGRDWDHGRYTRRHQLHDRPDPGHRRRLDDCVTPAGSQAHAHARTWNLRKMHAHNDKPSAL
jgi:hypothetical protein